MKGSDMTVKLARSKVDLDSPPPLTAAQREELARLAEMKDEDVDVSDILPLTEKFWSNAVRFRDRQLVRPVKKQVTVRLDADILDWFKAKQGGARGYQTAINAALRGVVEGERRKG
jgi:uncharacterized protein (DUF4415 family)